MKPKAVMVKGKRARILVVDDEVAIQRVLRLNLTMSGYEVLVAENGKEALEQVKAHRPDLIILDLSMPGEIHGLDVCAQVRQWMPKVPIIILSSLTEDKLKVEALDLGADDYLTKPFSNDELQARVRVCLRRANASDSSHVDGQEIEMLSSEDGYLSMYMGSRRVRAGDKDVQLTPTEFELLRQLMLHSGKVLTHRNLLKAVWGPEYGEEADYLRVYVRQLRRKVEAEPSRPRYIITQPGIGYIFRATEHELQPGAERMRPQEETHPPSM